MPEGEFAYFHFTGGRFETDEDQPLGMPLEALGELSVYRELVVEVARHLWKLNHPERQRAPKRFGASLDLRLERIDGGSVTPVVKRRESQGSIIDDDFDEGRDLITQAIEGVAAGGHLPRAFPRAQVTRLSRFGSRLGPDERLDFGHPTNSERRTSLDLRTSELLQKIAETLTTEQHETRVRGYIVEIDTDSETFELRDVGGRRIGGAVYGSDIAESVRDWLVVDGVDERLVEVVGTVLVDAEGEVLRFDGRVTAEEVPVAGIMAVFDALEAASDSADAAGTPIAAELIRSLHERARTLAARLPMLGIVAIDEGALRLEWEIGAVHCSAEFEATGGVYMHRWDNSTAEDAEWEGHLAHGGWAMFDAFVGGGDLV